MGYKRHLRPKITIRARGRTAKWVWTELGNWLRLVGESDGDAGIGTKTGLQCCGIQWARSRSRAHFSQSAVKNLPIYDPLKTENWTLGSRFIFTASQRERARERERESRVPYNICVEFICRRYGFNVHPLCIKIHEIPQLQNEPNALFTPGETPFSQSRQLDGKGAGAVGREVPNFMVHLAWRL